MSQVFGDPKRLVNDYMAASHAIGISSDSCVAVSEILRNDSTFTDLFQTAAMEDVRALIELLISVISVAPEFALDAEPPVDYAHATLLWLRGGTITAIEEELLGSVDSGRQFASFAGQFFVHTLPWAASVMVLLARQELKLSESDMSPLIRSLPTMIRFGVPTPEAAWCMSVGIRSRRAAIEIAADYRVTGGETSYAAFGNWFAKLEVPYLRERYSLQGTTLETAVRAVTQFGASLLSDQEFDVATVLPIEVDLVGTQEESRWAVALSLREGESLVLQREIDNAYDRNAILALRGGFELGYVPRLRAQLLAPEIDSGLRLGATVKSTQEGKVTVVIELE